MAFGGPASAVQSVRVSVEFDAIDLTRAVERYSAQGDRIQVSTAPGADGIVRRIEVSALEPEAQPAWIVFALTNDSDEQLTRLIVAPAFPLCRLRRHLAGSRLVANRHHHRKPGLGARTRGQPGSRMSSA